MPSPQLFSATQLLDLAWQYINSRNFRRAVQKCEALNQQFPDDDRGWYASSCLASILNNPEGALQAIDRAIELRPNLLRYRLQKAQHLLDCGEKEKSMKLALDLVAENHSDVSECSNLAELLSKFGCYEQAKALYLRAIELSPQTGRLHLNLAIIKQFLGDLDGASDCCDQAIALNKFDYDAYLLRSRLKIYSESNNHVSSLQQLLDEGINDLLGKAKICYALAKELEDTNHYQQSFQFLKLGADTFRKQIFYDLDSDLKFLDKIIKVYNKPLFDTSVAGDESTEPIFILGLPRSGTTLVERIISSHNDVFSAGELTNFTKNIVEITRQNCQEINPSRTDIVALTAKIDFKSLGQAYLNSTRPLTGHTRHFIDKFPQNSLNCGPIHLALPNAKIILLQRHPLDTCYAMYKQLFTDIYQFSYDLTELGQYFIAHQKLIEHWLSVIPEAIHVVRYEELINNTEDTVRSILEYCELPWQQQCLEFHENPQASTTASASQVRQKLYSSSIGRWKDYEQQLEPLQSMLEQAGYLEY